MGVGGPDGVRGWRKPAREPQAVWASVRPVACPHVGLTAYGEWGTRERWPRVSRLSLGLSEARLVLQVIQILPRAKAGWDRSFGYQKPTKTGTSEKMSYCKNDSTLKWKFQTLEDINVCGVED